MRHDIKRIFLKIRYSVNSAYTIQLSLMTRMKLCWMMISFNSNQEHVEILNIFSENRKFSFSIFLFILNSY